MTQCNWREEHGESYSVPLYILDMVGSGELRDLSWKNDSCPAFGIDVHDDGERMIRIWVEHPDEESREMDGPRFTVTDDLDDDGWESTDRLDEAIWDYRRRVESAVLSR